MAVPITCPNPSCRSTSSVEEQSLGRRGRCKKCGQVFELARPGGEAALIDEPARKPANPLAGPINLPEQFGRYRIIRQLGQGGMGAVYLAQDTKLNRQVALKVPFFGPGDGPQAIPRFEREARAVAALEHPNLCPVFDVGEIDGIHYLTMPFIDGKTLSEAMDRDQVVTEAQAAAVARKLALALQEAHDKGIIHRDLKPGNVMVNRRRELIIMDFGLARVVDGDDKPITRTGHVLGTALYMAPEQAAGDIAAIGPAADVYSLGVMLYELLTGQRPFEGPWSLVIGLKNVMDPEPPSKYRTDLSPSLNAICLKAIARSPTDRYASMVEFAGALDGFLALTVGPIPLPTGSQSADPVERPESLAAQVFAGLITEDRTSLRAEKASPPSDFVQVVESSTKSRPAWMFGVAGAALIAVVVASYLLINKNRTGIAASDTRPAPSRTKTRVDVAPGKSAIKNNDIKLSVNKNEASPSVRVDRFDSIPSLELSGSKATDRDPLSREPGVSTRWKWAHANGHFLRHADGTWEETSPQGVKYRFVETSRSDDCIELRDGERAKVALFDGFCVISLPSTTPKSSYNFQGGWVIGVPPEEKAPEPVASTSTSTSTAPVAPTPPAALKSRPDPSKSAASPSRFPPGAIAFGGSRYKLFPENLSWLQARMRCEAMGGHLAIVMDEDENRFLTSLVAAAGLEAAWLGATDELVEGRWVWVNGMEMKYENWDRLETQPNNGDGKRIPENYAILRVSRNGGWWDTEVSCEPIVKTCFVCEWEESRPATAPKKGTAKKKASEAAGAPSAVGRADAGQVFEKRGAWSVEGGELRQTSRAKDESEFPYIIFGKDDWSSYDLTFQATQAAGSQAFGLNFHWQGFKNKMTFGLASYNHRGMELASRQDGKWGRENGYYRDWSFDYDRWYTVAIQVRGSACRCYLDGELIFEQVGTLFDHGRVGLCTWETSARFRNISITATDGTVLFQGLPDLRP